MMSKIWTNGDTLSRKHCEKEEIACNEFTDYIGSPLIKNEMPINPTQNTENPSAR